MLWSSLYPLALFGLLSASSSTLAKPVPAKVDRLQVDAAVHCSSSYYNATDGRFDTAASWWLTGNALTGVLEWTAKTHSWQYMPQVMHTIHEQKKPLPWWPSGGGIFRADSTDDTGWYALAMLRMFDITKDAKYLDYAVTDAEYLQSFESSACGGGIIWDIPSRTYKNAISNELYLSLTAGLANRLHDKTKAKKYLDIAKKQYTWFVNSGMINKDSLINDGLTDGCANNGGKIWSYNQGVILGGLAELYKADGGKRKYLKLGRRIADAVLASPAFSTQGILTELCEPSSSCNSDQDAFKGIFMRNLDKINKVLPGAPYTSYIQRQAAYAYSHDRNGTDFYGVQWTGPVGQANVGTQGLAVSLLVAAL
ncbi:related to DCW1-Mannosidase, GPI-anchored membrane protein [Sporisorium reilianum f. sp. reilianum]|uniref:Related to DCW1-Mannosidase, GPI-anchored membrane protein n=1 Tax=Sporisorium reilianum f. sp. reilianum TaxID=72559 RepID=A0A2N8UNB6_9BASI|nr:related to DCW1-Mannosidase, GPI-anchored membrane protein [Sporisorium reilianum f. sp. reilianum]